MDRNFKDALKSRRSYYAISNSSPISDDEIIGIVEYALLHVPSAFNSQSTRIVVLLGENHKKLWNITKENLRKIVPTEAFSSTESKINDCFAAGFGSLLFFEDQSIIKGLQKDFAAYSDNFPIWSEQTAGMHQLAIWTMLEDSGLGASLQHYNPVIDADVAKEWNIDSNWKLVAQMPFGTPTMAAAEKQFQPLENRLKVFK